MSSPVAVLADTDQPGADQPDVETQPEVVVQLDELVREFGARRALDNVSLSIDSQAGIVALLGPNGAGKTTLLATLAGLLEPTAGEACLFGTSVFPPTSAVLRRVAVVLDGCEPPRRTRLRSLLMLRSGADPAFDVSRALALLAAHRLDPTQRWHTLSKGQKRFVLVLLAVCSSATLLLLDEPADGLDPEVRRELYTQLREQADTRGATIILASHILSDVERMADRVIIVQDGRLQLDESLETLREEVAEVELTATLANADLPGDVQLLGRRVTSDGELVWLRYHGADSQREGSTLRGERTRRRASLEAVYLAVTGQHG